MLQKLVVILVGLVMSLVGALSPSGLFATNGQDSPGLGADVVDETLATVRTADGQAFARVPVLWVEVDGRRVTDDAWGTGELKEIRFKVGVKGVDGVALAVGDRIVELHPTDVMTVRMFKGDFSYRGMSTTQPTLQLQGSVKTTLLAQGDVTTRVRTENGPAMLDGVVQSPAREDDGRVAYVVLDTGKRVDTVAVEDGGSRLFTEEAAVASEAKNEVGNLLAKWVKVDGKLIREYTWGEGSIGKIEFEPAEATTRSVVLAFDGAPTEIPAGTRVAVEDFVGEYVIYQVSGGLMRLRLDGYAAAYATAPAGSPLPVQTGPGEPVPSFSFSPPNPKTTDVVQFRDGSTDDGIIVFRAWDFGDNTSSVLPDPTHRFRRAGPYEVTLNVTDNDLRTQTITRTILVRNAEPVPDFDFSPKIVTTDTVVTFSDQSFDTDGTILNWTWTFGDGEVSHARHPSHRFARGGNLTVTLTVTDELQGKASLSKVVPVRNSPPLAAFTYRSTDPEATSIVSQVPVQFLDNSTDRDGRVVAWNWSFGDGSYATGANPKHAYPRPGLYTVSLTATDDAGDSDTASTQIVVQNRAPSVEFTWTPHGAPANVLYTFTSLARDPDGLVLAHSWDWGDGSERSFGASASHIFSRAGTYRVNLTVTDNSLESSFLVREVTVANSAPLAVMGINPSPAFRGDEVTFFDVSKDPDGDAIQSRVWDFGDGSTATTAIANHTYREKGTYLVNLTVVDVNGNANSVMQSLRVLNRAPVASATNEPRTPFATQVVFFNGSAYDPDGQGPFRYRWTFPDGSTDERQNTTYTFADQGDYTVTLRVVDDEGGISNAVYLRLRIDYAYPLAAFDFEPATPATLEPVTFTDRSTSPNGAIVSRVWDFKDGSVSQQANPSHVFNTSGTHWVSLTVTDVQERTSVIQRPVVVNARPQVSFAAPTGVIPLQQEVTFTDLSTDPDGFISVWAWDFGDGTTSALPSPPHTFSRPGTYPVRLTVTDDKGATNTTQRLVSVENQRPVARWAVANPSPLAGDPVQFVSTGYAYDPDETELRGWNWTFGDGRRSTETDPVHTYAASGRYLVHLRVTDGALESATDQGSFNYVRIGANHSVTVSVSAKFPDNDRRPDLLDSRYDVELRVGTPATGVTTFPKTAFMPNGTHALDVVIPSGVWMQGDVAVVTLRDRSFMASPMEKSVLLTDLHGVTRSASLLFEIPLPLDPTVQPLPGNRNATIELPLFTETNRTGDGDPVYRDMTERFTGTGQVAFRDGAAAPGAVVEIQARYVPLRVLGSYRDAADGGNVAASLLGWCRVASTTTRADGSYDWAFDPVHACATNSINPAVYPAGRWEIRAKASLTFATTGLSPAKAVYVDPTGGALLGLPFTLV